MKNQHFLTSTFILIHSMSIFCQDKETKTIKIKDVTFQFNQCSEKNAIGTLGDYKLLAPNSVILNQFQSLANKTFATEVNNLFIATFGIQLNKNFKKGNPILRLGLSSNSLSNLSSSYLYTNSARYDTLTSSQTGHSFYQDTSYTEYYSMRNSSTQLKFNGSLNFSTNPEKRWSLFGGIGFGAGISVNNKTTIRRTISHGIDLASGQSIYSPYQYDANMSNGYYTGSDHKIETFKNKSNICLSAFLPIGLDFRLGKFNPVLKKIHVFYEFRPSFNCTIIPELRSIYKMNFQNGLAIRYVLK